MIKIIDIVILTLLTNNFLYKYFIGVNFFENTDKKKKLYIALKIFTLLFLVYIIGEIIVYLYPQIRIVKEIFYVLSVFIVYIVTILAGRIIKLGKERSYYGTSIFLINMIINISFEGFYLRLISVFIVPIFLYLNFLFLEPLFERLRLDSKKGAFSYEITFLLTLGMITMIINGLMRS